MNLDDFLEEIPEFAVDIKLNAKNLLATTVLSQKLAQMIFLGCAFAAKSEKLVQMFESSFTELEEKERKAAKISAVLMNMNNVYYRFIHLVGNAEYGKMPVGLRMNGFKKHGIESNDFELISMAISALNGCGMCMESHERTALKHGVEANAIQEAIKIAATVNSLAALAI